MCPWRWAKKSSTEEGSRDKDLFSFFRISSQRANIIIIISCLVLCHSLLFRSIISNTLMSAWNTTKPLSQVRNHHNRLLKPRLRFIALINGIILPNFKKDRWAWVPDHVRSASYVRICEQGLICWVRDQRTKYGMMQAWGWLNKITSHKWN